jgi:Flp pilus assembly protein TadD
MMLAPTSAEPLNALGSLMASEGKTAQAEKFYRDALNLKPSIQTELAARHNLALLLAGIKGRQNEAVAAFRDNLTKDPTYLASRLSLAELLTSTGDTNGAIEQYTMVVNARPEYVAARTALAGLYMKANQTEPGVEQLRAAAKLDAQNAAIWEQIGDAERMLNHPDQAREAFATALKLQINNSDKKRIRTKMAF